MFGYVLAFGFVALLIVITVHSPPIIIVTVWPIIGIPAAILSHLKSKKK